MPALDQKVALITGAKGGLGNFVTEAFLEAGATVVGVSRSIQASDFPHARFAAMPAELSSGEAARRLADEVAARFQKIDILVHLVGGFAGGKPVHQTDDETFERMLDVNLKSAFYMARAVLPHMRNRGGGRILAIGSAAENKDRGISANVILPGMMDTPLNRKFDPQADYSKWVQPGQVASLLLSLASDAMPQVSGAAIPIYGAEV